MDLGLEFKLPARVRKKGKWFISSCPPLDVHSQGRTKDEAERNLVDALTSFFISCYERGTLDAVLHDAGFVPVMEPRATRPHVDNGAISVSVPVPFVIASRAGRLAASA